MRSNKTVVLLLACGFICGNTWASSMSTCTVGTATATSVGDFSSSCSAGYPSTGPYVIGFSSASATGGASAVVYVESAMYSYNPNLYLSSAQSGSTSIDSIFDYSSHAPLELGTITMTYGGVAFQTLGAYAVVTDGLHTYTVGCFEHDCPNFTTTQPFNLGSSFSIEVVSSALVFNDSLVTESDPQTELQLSFSLADLNGSHVDSILAPEPGSQIGCGVLIAAILIVSTRRSRPLN